MNAESLNNASRRRRSRGVLRRSLVVPSEEIQYSIESSENTQQQIGASAISNPEMSQPDVSQKQDYKRAETEAKITKKKTKQKTLDDLGKQLQDKIDCFIANNVDVEDIEQVVENYFKNIKKFIIQENNVIQDYRNIDAQETRLAFKIIQEISKSYPGIIVISKILRELNKIEPITKA